MVSVAPAVTLPDPAGVAQVPSPRQNVVEDADVPEFRLVTGRFPVTSAERLTALNDGRPAALPCNTVVVVPREASVCDPCEPEPTTTALAVNEADEVTQVAQAMVPVVVMVPPVMGLVVAMLVTVPVPGGAAHVPSPRQKVEAEALVPLFRFVTGRLPVMSAARFTAAKLGAPAALPCSTVVVDPAEPRIVTAWLALPKMIRFAVRLDPVTQVGQEIVPVVVMVPPAIGEVVAIELTDPEPPGTAHVPSPRQKVVPDAEVPLLR